MSFSDFQKVFDQAVRDITREVNKTILKVPEIEQKTLDATSNEPWGPHGQLMSELAQGTRTYNELQMIMSVLWKRLQDSGKDWRHVYKALTVMEFLIAHGAERVVDELRERLSQIKFLQNFQYIEPNGKDQGINVRKKAETLVALLVSKDKIRETRQKAAANRDKYRGISSSSARSGAAFSSSSYGDEERRGGSRGDRYGDDPYGEGGRHRGDGAAGPYGGEDPHTSKRSAYDDDGGFYDYGRSKYGDSGPKSAGRYESGDFDDEVGEFGRKHGGKFDNGPRSAGSNVGARDRGAHHDGGLAGSVAGTRGSRSQDHGSAGLRSTRAADSELDPSAGGYSAPLANADEDDDFDPRGHSAPAVAVAPRPPAAELDLFGLDTEFSPAPAPAPQAALGDLFGDSSFGAFSSAADSFPAPTSVAPPAAEVAPAPAAASSSFAAFSIRTGGAPTPAPANGATAIGGAGFDAFGPSMLAPAGGADAATAKLPPAARKPAATLLAPPPPPSSNSLHAPSPGPTLQPGPPAGAQPPIDLFGADPFGPIMTAAAPAEAPGLSANAPAKKGAEAKSQLWLDAMSSGLVDLELTGGRPEKVSLHDLGIDLESSPGPASKPADRRREQEAVRPQPGMGRAMGSGTGAGLAAAQGLAPPPPPMTQPGMGFGMGGGMSMGGRSMGGGPHGMGAPPAAGMGMGMGVGMPPMGAFPPMGVPPYQSPSQFTGFK